MNIEQDYLIHCFVVDYRHLDQCSLKRNIRERKVIRMRIRWMLKAMIRK